MKSAFLTLLLALTSIQTEPLGVEHCKCSIEVIVKRSNGEPLSQVIVTIASGDVFILPTSLNAASTTTARTVMTDSDGRVDFRDLAEGKYTVGIQRDGYASPSKEDTVSLSTPSVLVEVGPITPGIAPKPMPDSVRIVPGGVTRPRVIQPAQQLEFTLVPGSVISGRLTDRNQEPASNVSISAFRVTYLYGHRTLQRIGNSMTTDDHGAYRLYGLPPGEYYVRAESTGSSRSASGIPTLPAVTYFPGFPGTIDPSRANSIKVEEGQEQSGIDFRIFPIAGVTVSGTVRNEAPGGGTLPNGQTNRRPVGIYIQPRNSYFSESPKLLQYPPELQATSKDPNISTFEIRNVPPGSYDLYFPFLPGLSQLRSAVGRATVEVGTVDVRDVTANIHSGVMVEGHLTIAGVPPDASTAQVANVATLRIYLGSVDNYLNPTISGIVSTAASPDRQNNFAWSNVAEGRYFISFISGLPTDAYVSELKLGSRSFYNEGSFEIGSSPPEPLQIMVSRNGGNIQGTVVDSQGHEVNGARVTLLPDAPRRGNTLLYQSVATDSSGAFAMTAVAPGTYRLFAWQNSPNGAEQNSDFLKDYESMGVSIAVGPGANVLRFKVPVIAKQK